MPKSNRSLKPLFITGGVILAIILILSLLFISGIFHRNPYGPEIKIDNFTTYYKTVPDNIRDHLFATLYDNVELNSEDKSRLTKPKASIRENSVAESYNQTSGFYTSTALVDLPTIQQSYSINLYWNPENTEEDSSLAAAVAASVSCPKKSDLIYPDFNCKNAYGTNSISTLFDKYPIMSDLPIKVAFYESGYGTYVSYEISCIITEDDEGITLTITDYTGGNYDRALKKLADDYNIKPDDLPIKYIDQSAYQIPGKAP